MRARVGFAAAFAAAAFLAASRAAAVCPPECSGQTITAGNFSRQDLIRANFTGATIIGGKFIGADLQGAKFDNAKFQSIPGAPTSTPDFSFADLTNASFTGAQFLAPTYLTFARLTCADFSRTDISNGNAIFGDDPLISDAGATCADGQKSRTKFQSTIMNCEFIDDWKSFDLTGATVTACLTQLSGRDFSGALMSGVDFTGAVLDGDLFVGANLVSATLINTSLQCTTPGFAPKGCVDMTNASLQGAHLDNANLTSASLYGAVLSNDNGNGTFSATASVTQAHLKNVNLATAQLSGVNFTLANFYGTNPAANPGGCATTGGDNKTGFTIRCATAYGATMTGTQFVNAYLYGVDFGGLAKIAGVDFSQAVLVGANFGGAKIGKSGDGTKTSFYRAYLQGANLVAQQVDSANLSNAFLDFRVGGNIISIHLSGANHNQFACSTRSPCKPPSGRDVCVEVRYPTTAVPEGETTITCPDGKPAGSGGCGEADPSGGNSRWQSHLTINSPPPGVPPGWYTNPPTYPPQGIALVCDTNPGIFADW